MSRNSFIYFSTQSIARTLFSLLYQIKTDREEEVDVKGPAVILPKHQYWTDIPLVSLSFRFPLLFVAKKELFRLPGVRFYLSSLGGVPVDRDRSIRTFSSMKYLLSSLRENEKVVLFPEGTYVREAVGLGKNRLIQMILGVQSELKRPIPFIPMGIRYGERRGCRRRVEIRIGSPLFAEGESDAGLLTNRIMDEISRLTGLPKSHRAHDTKERRA